MNSLKKYLKDLSNCPDKIEKFEYRIFRDLSSMKEDNLLTIDFGITDNWRIYLKENPSKFRKFLNENGYRLFRKEDSEYGNYEDYAYSQGTVILRLSEDTYFFKKWNEHKGKNITFNLNATLHPYQKQKGKKSKLQMLSHAIQEIGNHALQKRIPIIFPNSTGLRRGERAILKPEYMIYYDPEEE